MRVFNFVKMLIEICWRDNLFRYKKDNGKIKNNYCVGIASEFNKVLYHKTKTLAATENNSFE